VTGAKIMVVEDERIVALHLRQQLLKLGYDVPAPIASGELALRELEHLHPDLVLMDIHIEGQFDGIETAARIPQQHHIPVIYLTAFSEPATLDRARLTRPYGYLLKPFSERELHATIQMALERCRADKTQRESEAALRQAQKMESIGLLAGGVAHDFNNLLGVIIGNLDSVIEAGIAESGSAHMVQEALGSALRGASLTRQLLAYSRRQTLDPHVLSLDRVVSDMTELLRRTLGETIQIQARLPAALWKACIDPNQLANALLNLAVNARDAMPAGGRLTIEGDNVVLDQTYADQNSEIAPGPYVLLAVSDTGTGMTQETIDQAFEPFFTTKPVGAGTGLGLSMVYGFVKQSKGHIKIYSELGRGTTIKLYLPAAETAAEDPNQLPISAPMPMARSGEVILLVEDDPALRKLVNNLLVSLGYTVIDAPDGPTACTLLDRTARVDLVLTDVILPKGMNGPAFAREAQARRPGLKILYMSGYAKTAIVHNGVLDEGTHLLMKPFRKADLACRLRQLLDDASPG
jgi:signal transduction histidine kinase